MTILAATQAGIGSRKNGRKGERKKERSSDVYKPPLFQNLVSAFYRHSATFDPSYPLGEVSFTGGLSFSSQRDNDRFLPSATVRENDRVHILQRVRSVR